MRHWPDQWAELFQESGWHTVHETVGSLRYSTIFFSSIFIKKKKLIRAAVAVDETSGSRNSSTSYQVPGTLQETGWEIFTIRAEEDRSWKVFAFVFTYGFFFPFFFAAVLCACICLDGARRKGSLPQIIHDANSKYYTTANNKRRKLQVFLRPRNEDAVFSIFECTID